MSDELREAFEEVQRRKTEPFEASSETVEHLAARLKEELGPEVNTAAIKATLDGIGWTGRMIAEFDLDAATTAAIPDELATMLIENVLRAEMPLSKADALRAGVGGGFFTGLYVGLLLEAGRHEDA